MSHHTGTTGNVEIGTAIAGIKSWTIDYIMDELEVTDFGCSGVAEYLPGVTRWSGTFEGYKDGVPLTQACSTVSCVLSLQETSTPTQYWGGATAYITGVHATTSFDGIVSYSYDFRGSGAIIKPTT